MQLIAGLQHSLDLLLAEGLDQVFSRHFKMAEGIRQAAASWGYKLCCRDLQFASDTVTYDYGTRGFNGDRSSVMPTAVTACRLGSGLGNLRVRRSGLDIWGTVDGGTSLEWVGGH